VQNAKDTFYEVICGRLVGVNPERTIVLRGVVRPGVLVEENELLSAIALPDCFRLEWSVAKVDPGGKMPLVTLQCSFLYETAGSAINGGIDRGRALAAMDAELQSVISALPQNSLKMNYAGLAFRGVTTAMSTNVWWSDSVFGETVVNNDRLARTTTVQVMSYQEAGEL